MIQRIINNNSANRIVGHLVAEKKKIVIAVCLVALMAFMWIRVLFKKTTAVEGGTLSENTLQQDSIGPTTIISFVDLPEVEGRHDIITRDFFNSENWQNFSSRNSKNVVSIEEVNIVSGDIDEEVIRKIAEELKLEAVIGTGENANAYINDQVVSAGDRITVIDGIQTYECEVVLIEDDSVVIGCGKSQVKLKIKKVSGNSDS